MKQPDTWISTAPASTMIMGEHAVVYGQPALVAALDHWLTIRWQRRNDRRLIIRSQLAEHETTLDEMTDHPRLRFILAPLRQHAGHLPGLELTIHSDIPSDMGLGSSAAALAATLTGLQPLLPAPLSRLTLFEQGREMIRQIQGRGSGADLAASLYGGMILLEPGLPAITPVPFAEPMTLIYSGYKTPTAEVLKKVRHEWAPLPDLQDALYQLMGDTVRQAIKALALNDDAHILFRRLFNVYHGLMDALGVCDLTLAKIVYQVREKGHAAKISGSGLGDCVLALGEVQLDGYRCLPVTITEQGARWETD